MQATTPRPKPSATRVATIYYEEPPLFHELDDGGEYPARRRHQPH